MRYYEASATIAAAPDAVWAILADGAAYPDWDSGVSRVEGTIAPGETIISAGDPGNFLYVILGGEAKTVARPAGRALRTGDYFGEVAMIDGRPRSATVVAASELQVMRLPSRSVVKLARRHPAIPLAMLENLTTRLRRLETESARSV